MRMVTRTLTAAGIAGLLLVTAGCGGGPGSTTPTIPPPPPFAEPQEQGATQASVAATFGPDEGAFTYNTELVPEGAQIVVSETVANGNTTIQLNVRGLQGKRRYGAHVHVNPCGPAPEDAGPHYQRVPAPPGASMDPQYANPQNEVWLDFVTNPSGEGSTAAVVNWVFGDPPPGSVVIHAEPTRTAPGEAGDAGARLACVTVGF